MRLLGYQKHHKPILRRGLVIKGTIAKGNYGKGVGNKLRMKITNDDV
jgi:hypothetical protein